MGAYDELPEVESAYTGGWAGAANAGAFSGSGGSSGGDRHRSYGWTYAPVPDTMTPMGGRNTGYVTGTVPGYQSFQRGELGGAMPDSYGFGLPRPRYMREPGATWGSYPSMKE